MPTDPTPPTEGPRLRKVGFTTYELAETGDYVLHYDPPAREPDREPYELLTPHAPTRAHIVPPPMSPPPPPAPQRPPPVPRGTEVMPCLVLVEGSLAPGVLVPGVTYRVVEVREHWEPTGVEGEPPHVSTVIRFDPVREAVAGHCHCGEFILDPSGDAACGNCGADEPPVSE